MSNNMERYLLEYLDKFPIGKYADLKEYFKSKYPNHEEIAKDIKVTLDECLIDQSLIRLSDETGYQKLGSLLTAFDKYYTLNNLGVQIKAKITMKGRSYLNEQRRLEKQDELNESFKKLNEIVIPSNNKKQVNLTIAIAFAAVVSAIFTGLTFFKSCESNDKYHTRKQVEVLYKKIPKAPAIKYPDGHQNRSFR